MCSYGQTQSSRKSSFFWEQVTEGEAGRWWLEIFGTTFPISQYLITLVKTSNIYELDHGHKNLLWQQNNKMENY